MSAASEYALYMSHAGSPRIGRRTPLTEINAWEARHRRRFTGPRSLILDRGGATTEGGAIGAEPEPTEGPSTTTYVLIGAGVLAAAGVGIYLFTRKGKRR